MKINIKSLIKSFIIIVVIYQLGYLKLTFVGNAGNISIRFFIVLEGIFLTIYLKIKKKIKSPKFLNFYIFMYLFIIIIEIIRTNFFYKYNIEEIKNAIIPFLYLFWVYPILYLFQQEKSYDSLMRITSKLVIIMLFIKFIIWILYNYFGILLFPSILFEFSKWSRNGIQRINSGFLIGIVFAYFIQKGIIEKESKKYIIYLIYIFLFVTIITNFRFQSIALLITLVLINFFSNLEIKRLIVKRFLIIVIIGAMLNTSYVNQFIDSFSVNGVYSTSTIARLQTWEHYNKLLKDKKILGLGLLEEDNYNAGLIMKHLYGHYYLDDLGILGGYVRFGGLGLAIIYILLFYYAIKVTIKCIKNKKEIKEYSFLLAMVTYMIFSCIGLNIFDFQRAFDIPFYLAIISWFDYKIKNIGDLK